jgi:formiminotetrahydrofolate cyclodeaminase
LNTLNRDKENYEDLFTRLIGQIEEIEVATDELRRKLDEDKKIFKELVFPEDE